MTTLQDFAKATIEAINDAEKRAAEAFNDAPQFTAWVGTLDDAPVMTDRRHLRDYLTRHGIRDTTRALVKRETTARWYQEHYTLHDQHGMRLVLRVIVRTERMPPVALADAARAMGDRRFKRGRGRRKFNAA